MKLFLVAVPLEFPLANYCLAAHLAATPETSHAGIEILSLDSERMHAYSRKNGEIWRYLARVDAVRPDIIAFSTYLWSHLNVWELIAITRRLYPRIAIIVGGPEMATVSAVTPWLDSGHVTAAVRGEGEVTMTEIVKRVQDGASLAGVPGCSWWNGTAVVHEAPRPPIRDLCELASPYLTGWVPDDLFDRHGSDAAGAFPRAFVETYRGCYMQCSYCQWGNGTPLRFEFSQERVLAELSWIISRHVNRLWIVDAMFGFKKRTAKDLLRHIIAEKRRYQSRTAIVCYHNQDFFDHELFDLYREANVSVEVDLQSTNKDVLTRVGRAKWYIDSFDRHLDAFKTQQVPTTGAADLIIGLPRDNYQSFAESIDFLLRRGMNINLYQTSIIPDTAMSRSIAEDGSVFSDIAPRAVFKNDTFPVHEMVAARLIGHGVDFFGRYPKTARLLWTHAFERPVDLCIRLGTLVWERHGLMYGESHTYDAVLSDQQGIMGPLVEELCPHDWLRPLLCDVFRLEAKASLLSHPPTHAAPWPVLRAPADAGLPRDASWLDARPRFRQDAVQAVRLEYRIDRPLQMWNQSGEMPEDAVWRAAERTPRIALVHLSARGVSSYRMVDADLMYPLLQRFNGFFSVAACLDTFVQGWRTLPLTPLWEQLAAFAESGLIDTGLSGLRPRAADAGESRSRRAPIGTLTA